MRRIVLLAFLALMAGQAQAIGVFMTGSKILENCEGAGSPADFGSPADVGRWATCHGYVAGIHDIAAELFDERAPPYCMPSGEAGVTMFQLALVVHQWLREHPEELHKSASGLVWRAFKEAFPCK